ncbi:MAG: hypothetical protein LBU96_16780 [Yokenella regensburgei]|uniref:Uncharacterized protein n=1 Tax=Yokenella regensburgei TaxID=158877 RepID=A0AB38FT23_9ENTR|nr:hypothetical protein [Yokenella regensburgei]EHM50870.1 hypothetical protein HMPREF0880_00850 [Yokenella regensburgei ATCC 43003]KFD23507.1 hypothetical protein GYRE_02118 [Yokenella regensburgei ATCC 49455]MDQ4430258.1 hypothetical protein [Yokenella regensburgei]MDR3106082.1 hypothetical protein [Yokenella regensburgei]QIU90124.1 hypothetical protein HEC60_12800 [Yokenella regensburgei]
MDKLPVNIHTLSRYAAHVSLRHTLKSHTSPALSVMAIFTDLCIRSTEDAYSEQGWEISERQSGMVFRNFVATHECGAELEITPKDYIGRYNRLLPLDGI